MAMDVSVLWRWVNAAVVIGCSLVPLALLLPGIKHGHEAQHRAQSKNNLKGND